MSSTHADRGAELVAVAAAARRIGISTKSFVASAPVPIFFVGGRRYTFEADLRAWIDALREQRRAS